MVTHDIGEAISMANIVIVLSRRPSVIKNIYRIELDKYDNPIDKRTDIDFNHYYKMIWEDLDINV
jgi:NitT/TauT family transport system ATP-binding protein